MVMEHVDKRVIPVSVPGSEVLLLTRGSTCEANRGSCGGVEIVGLKYEDGWRVTGKPATPDVERPVTLNTTRKRLHRGRCRVENVA